MQSPQQSLIPDPLNCLELKPAQLVQDKLSPRAPRIHAWPGLGEGGSCLGVATGPTAEVQPPRRSLSSSKSGSPEFEAVRARGGNTSASLTVRPQPSADPSGSPRFEANPLNGATQVLIESYGPSPSQSPLLPPTRQWAAADAMLLLLLALEAQQEQHVQAERGQDLGEIAWGHYTLLRRPPKAILIPQIWGKYFSEEQLIEPQPSGHGLMSCTSGTGLSSGKSRS